MKYSEATDLRFFNLEEISSILADIKRLKLDTPEGMSSLSITVFSRVCDGCGDAGKQSLVQRKAITLALPDYVPAFFIYDVDRFLGTDLEAARDRLISNARKCVLKQRGWVSMLNPRIWIECLQTIPAICKSLS